MTSELQKTAEALRAAFKDAPATVAGLFRAADKLRTATALAARMSSGSGMARPDVEAIREAAARCLAAAHRLKYAADEAERWIDYHVGASGPASTGGNFSPRETRATESALHGLSDVAANADAQQSTSGEIVGGGGGPGGNPNDNGKHTTIPPVALDEESVKPDNISQGQMGDCGLLANLAAVAKADPKFLQEQISYDEKSNTYTVTLYEDGERVAVTVEGSLIDAAAHAGDGTTAGWVSIYEKAAAQHRGGYAHIQRQPPEDLYEMITGQRASRYETDAILPWNERSVGQIRDDLTAGKPVTAWTPGDLDDPDIVAGHAYMVESVDQDGNVRVMNPWGPNVGEPHCITLSAEEFKSKFSEVAVSDKPEH